MLGGDFFGNLLIFRPKHHVLILSLRCSFVRGEAFKFVFDVNFRTEVDLTISCIVQLYVSFVCQ